MKIVTRVAVVFFSLFLLISVGTTTVNAQAGQIWETIVGNPQPAAPPTYDDEGNETGGTGPDDLGPGEFTAPFRCGLSYRGVNYVGHTHWAVDFNRGAPGHVGDDYGDPIFASADGVVINEIPENGQMAIRHDGGFVTVYAHFSKRLVHFGDRVKHGQKIGEIGNTYWKPGESIDAHLHYQQCTSRDNCWYPTDANTRQIKFKKTNYPFSCYSCSRSSTFNISCNWPS